MKRTNAGIKTDDGLMEQVFTSLKVDWAFDGKKAVKSCGEFVFEERENPNFWKIFVLFSATRIQGEDENRKRFFGT